MRLLHRIVNAPLGVTKADKLESEYALHCKRVRTMRKFDSQNRKKLTYSGLELASPKSKEAAMQQDGVVV